MPGARKKKKVQRNTNFAGQYPKLISTHKNHKSKCKISVPPKKGQDKEIRIAKVKLVPLP